jgi:hypothetical protein
VGDAIRWRAWTPARVDARARIRDCRVSAFLARYPGY